MMYLIYVFTLFILCFQYQTASSLEGTINIARLNRIFDEGIKSNDVASFYYSVRGYLLLNNKFPSTICQDLSKLKVEYDNIEQVFYFSNTAQITKCQNSVSPKLLKTANSVLENKDAALNDIYHAVKSLKALGSGTVYDKQDGFKNLLLLLKKDDSPINYGYLMDLCINHLQCDDWVLSQSKDLISQADLVDGKMLQWEGGLPATSILLSSIVKAHIKAGKPSPLTRDQSDKFAEYLLFRRSVNVPKGAALLLEAATALSDDKTVSPVVIVVKGKTFLSSDMDSIQLTVTDLIERPAKDAKTVTLESATRIEDNVVVASKKPLTQRGNIYELQLSGASPGRYRTLISAAGATTSINIAVLTTAKVVTADLSLADADGTSAARTFTVLYPNMHAVLLQADQAEKISLKFKLVDKNDKPLIVQQAFIRISSERTDNEVIFVAEPDSTKTYKVEVSVAVLAKHFSDHSGINILDLYIGDSSIATPIHWRLARVDIHFAQEPLHKALSPYTPLPEIRHMFREPESRPSRFVSDVFACACAAPLVLLIFMWFALRINISNFPLTISALVFHIGLGSILTLFVYFWLQLNMFETVRYLLGLGLITFISGHRLLSHLVKNNKL